MEPVTSNKSALTGFLPKTKIAFGNKNVLDGDGHIHSLTGLRAIAAGIVVLHHLVPTHDKGWLTSILEEMNVGVTIFFCLSGFLITFRYFEKFEKGKKWFYNYAVNRVARIYPMYFLLTTFTIVLSGMAARKFNVVEYLMNITFLRGFFGQYVYSGIAQGWTLTVEECFYFSAPLLFLLSRRIPVWIQAIGIFISGYLLYLIFRNTDFHGFMNNLPVIYITTYFGRIFEFAIGMMMAFWLIKGRKIKYATITGCLGFLAFFAVQVLINHFQQKFAIQTVAGFFINELLLPISVALVIYGLIKEGTSLKTFLQTRGMILLGKSSYTLYLLHWGMTSYLINRFVSSSWIVDIILTYLASIALWYFIEEPCNKYIRKFKR